MKYSSNNIEIAAQYVLGNTELYDAKDDDYKNLFKVYLCDNNSSSLRESITLHLLGYQQFESKHGADGIDTKTGKLKEVKPRMLSVGQKMSNSGNFNDMTLELLNKKLDYDIVCSLFYADRLVYIVEFPMSSIYEHLKEPILKAKLGKRVVCHFSHTKYDNNDLVVHYFNAELARSTKSLSKTHFAMLESRSK